MSVAKAKSPAKPSAKSAAKALPKRGNSKAIVALQFWHESLVQSLHSLPLDLSSRQMAIILHVYISESLHSVKSIYEELDISKPAICRALDVLEQHKLIKRQRDKDDKRNVYIHRTTKGSVYLSEFSDIVIKTMKKY